MFPKKLLLISWTMLLICSRDVSQAQTGNYQGVQYEINNGEYLITGFIGGYETVDIPDYNPFTRTNVNIVNIPDSAFTNSPQLKYFTFPSSVLNIGNNIFQGSTNLKTIYFRGSPPTISSNTFMGISNVIIFYNSNSPGWSNSYGGFITYPNSGDYLVQAEGDGREYAISGYIGVGGNVKIPMAINGLPVKRIKEFVFRYNTNLTSIEMPESITQIGDITFEDCFNLTNVIFSDNITYIGNWNFKGSSKLTNVKLPNNLISTGIRIFEGCSSLTNVSFGPYITRLNDSSFNSCTSLRQINIPTNIISIGNGVLEGCSGLQQLDIPANVATIGGSFSYCSSLESLNLSEGITSIGAGAFRYCTNLNEIKLPNTLTNLGIAAFAGCSKVTKVNTGDGLKSIPWSFMGLFGVEQILIGNSVELIQEGAFSNCYNLTNLVFGRSLKRIEGYTFTQATNLLSLKLPQNLEELGTVAFQGANKIKSVVFPASLTKLGNVGLFSAELYFKGNPPQVPTNFFHSEKIYYLAESSGWNTNNLNNSSISIWGVPKQSLEIQKNNNQIKLKFNSVAGFAHTLQESQDLVNWSNSRTVQGDGSDVTETTNENSVSKKFFRILRQ